MSWASIGEVRALVERALAEDLATGDRTSLAVVPEGARATAIVVAKESLRFCGEPFARLAFASVDPELRCDAVVGEGAELQPARLALRIEGRARSILAAERTALNFLQRASGVCSLTRAFVDAADGRCRIADTRKTMPGLRVLDRYAVRMGGGRNHRNDLGSGILLKENHLKLAGGIARAIAAAREHAPHLHKIACEVETLDELEEALQAGAEVVLLDDMTDEAIARAVPMARGRAYVEVSGGITLERVPRLCALGVDCISVGALTHSAKAADLSLLVVQETP